MHRYLDVIREGSQWNLYKCFRAALIPPWQLPIWADQGVYFTLQATNSFLETTDSYKQWSYFVAHKNVSLKVMQWCINAMPISNWCIASCTVRKGVALGVVCCLLCLYLLASTLMCNSYKTRKRRRVSLSFPVINSFTSWRDRCIEVILLTFSLGVKNYCLAEKGDWVCPNLE